MSNRNTNKLTKLMNITALISLSATSALLYIPETNVFASSDVFDENNEEDTEKDSVEIHPVNGKWYGKINETSIIINFWNNKHFEAQISDEPITVGSWRPVEEYSVVLNEGQTSSLTFIYNPETGKLNAKHGDKTIVLSRDEKDAEIEKVTYKVASQMKKFNGLWFCESIWLKSNDEKQKPEEIILRDYGVDYVVLKIKEGTASITSTSSGKNIVDIKNVKGELKNGKLSFMCIDIKDLCEKLESKCDLKGLTINKNKEDVCKLTLGENNFDDEVVEFSFPTSDIQNKTKVTGVCHKINKKFFEEVKKYFEVKGSEEKIS